ncbi:uncharacterized protein LTR77_003949 [Saxophila tyrrhenica]|uniref:Uncharacterized protein n=1 Tax=Saxophila tyrrhenica TaxID=1690608 RepID=A0AAV9PFB0_9PEZI|nr:hypothetical protein LTR77_003949 [Saxophila tyrrhenica]
MGRAYTPEQREQVRSLLELGRDEETIEKETGVSDRTIRRWKLELERTGRIGKPPESRTGRHRVLNDEIEAALFEHVKSKPDMSVDDMLWWIYDNYKIVVGTRTIRRVFERKGDKLKPGKTKGPNRRKSGDGEDEDEDDEEDDYDQSMNMSAQMDDQAPAQRTPAIAPSAAQPTGLVLYQSPYAPVSGSGDLQLENQLRQAMEQQTPQQQQPYPALMDFEGDLPDDAETIELQLQQIALQKREVELKLKMRRLKGTPESANRSSTSSLYNPTAAIPPPSKRDSRSKKKIEESKRRTAERQERMLRDLERRSRRRDHLTAEWVESKDIWPLRAQGLLADLMHQYQLYTYSQNNEELFGLMYQQLYGLVDHTKGDWDTNKHDELLRERMKRKMGQLRAKMQKTGEIVNRNDGSTGFEKAVDYTGEQAGAALGDESEMVQDPALHGEDPMQVQPGAPNMQPHDDHLQYDPMHHDQQMHQANMQYPAPMHLQDHGQYPLMDQHHQMMPYAPMGSQQGLSHQDGLVM